MTRDPRHQRRLTDNLLIAGVGLIGGSLALAARREGLVKRVVGLGRTRANLEIALARGIIDEGFQDPAEAAKNASLVLLAVPVRSAGRVASTLLPHLPPTAVITDAGSVKAETVGEMDDLLAGASCSFVGAHPIAGTEKSGASAARVDLFQSKKCIITPGASSTPEAVALVRELWRCVGMEVEEMTASTHDRILSLVSHLPHMLAFALLNTVLAASTPAEKTLRFAGSSFADATRVAGSSAEMWRDICLANRKELLKSLDEFSASLDAIRDSIEGREADNLEKTFAEARAARER